MMKSNSNMRVLLGALGAALSMNMPSANIAEPRMFNGPIKHAKARPKYTGSNTARGYRKVHVLSNYVAEQNLARAANSKSGFKGFRKVRVRLPSGMTVWQPV